MLWLRPLYLAVAHPQVTLVKRNKLPQNNWMQKKSTIYQNIRFGFYGFLTLLQGHFYSISTKQ